MMTKEKILAEIRKKEEEIEGLRKKNSRTQ